MNTFGHQREWCEGSVREKVVPREVFRHARGFVILEDVAIGVCEKCGRKYFSAQTLRRVEELALHRERAQRTESVPVARA